MSQISLNKSVVVYSSNENRLYLIQKSLENQEIDLKLTNDIKEVMIHLDTFEVQKFILDLDFNVNIKHNLKIANDIFITYFYKYQDKAKEKFVTIAYDEATEEFLNMMSIPNVKNTDFNFEEFLKFK